MRSTLTLFLTLFLAGCAFDQRMTHNAGIRRVASSRLATCLGLDRCKDALPGVQRACLDENNAYCASEGLEKNCGVDNLWTATYPCSMRLSHF